ncbi:MAG: hypothetical protein LBT91_00670 [Bifidobacteriaceae bacterium]|jgi:hypothetical protein|nr:hypothetical protein [Bifidobacteriaceae bacterium]
MSELFSIKKVGVLGIIFLFGITAFVSGFSVNSYAASSSTILPISRGGTGQNNLGDVNVGSATKLQTARTINGTLFDGTANIVPGGSWNTLAVYPDYSDEVNNFIYVKFSTDRKDDTGISHGGGSYEIKIAGSTDQGAIEYNIEYASKDLNAVPVKKLLYITQAFANSSILPAYGKIGQVLYFRLPPVSSAIVGAQRELHWFSTKPNNSSATPVFYQVTNENEKAQLKALNWQYFQQPNSVLPTPTPTATFTPAPAPTS